MSGSLVLVDEFTTSSAVASVTIGGGSSGSSSYNYAIATTYNVYLLEYTNEIDDVISDSCKNV